MDKSWAIKLGSGGRCVQFCEERKIVGIGWNSVDSKVAATGTREQLRSHIRDVCSFYSTERERGSATGQIFRFVRDCSLGDFILYYDPPKKRVVITRVISEPMFRDFAMEDDTDIWHYRRVEYPCEPVPILDLYGPLKGSLLGPRMSFWQLSQHEAVEAIASGGSATLAGAEDPEIERAYHSLRDLVLERAEGLNASDWEWLVVDYFKAQGAHVDERRVGGSQPIIDAEAVFYHGELGQELWRIQVKRYQNRPVDWATIQSDLEHLGAESRFCFVSVYGFTEEARARADDEGVLLLEAEDFTRFLISGRCRERLQRKLRLPQL